MASNADRVHACSELLQRIAQNLDQLSDVEALGVPQGSARELADTLNALHGVLAGADAVLSMEVKQWTM